MSQSLGPNQVWVKLVFTSDTTTFRIYGSFSNEKKRELSEWKGNNPDAHVSKANRSDRKQNTFTSQKISKHVAALISKLAGDELERITEVTTTPCMSTVANNYSETHHTSIVQATIAKQIET